MLTAYFIGVTFRLGATVADIDFHAPNVLLKGGETVEGDIIIGYVFWHSPLSLPASLLLCFEQGHHSMIKNSHCTYRLTAQAAQDPKPLTTYSTHRADGLNSITKELLLGKKVPPHPTGDLAYRLTVREADMRQHPILHDLIDAVNNDVWMGPDTFVVGYLLQGGGLYNIVLVHPDKNPDAADVTERASPEEMRELLKGWDPRLQALLSVVQQTQKWRMLTSREMSEWGHEGGRFVLLGDACHASLPYLCVCFRPSLSIHPYECISNRRGA